MILRIGANTQKMGFNKTLKTTSWIRNMKRVTMQEFEENGITTYREINNSTKKIQETYDKSGKYIKGSRFSTWI